MAEQSLEIPKSGLDHALLEEILTEFSPLLDLLSKT